MIVYFLLIVLVINVNITSGDGNEDETKYLETLPPSVKKTLLDRVARRILNEVPEVNSSDKDINGDILAGKLEEQSVFVKRILKQEVESLKNKRRHLQKLKKFRKSGDNNDQMSETSNSDKNETQVNDMDAKKPESDKIDADFGHVDLTLRSGRSKRGDSGVNNENTPKKGLTEDEHGNHGGDFVPVAVRLDGAKNNMVPSKDNIVSKVKKDSNEDIQIRKSKQKPVIAGTPNVVTKNTDNVDETTTKSNIGSKTTAKTEESSVKKHTGKRSEGLHLNKTEEAKNSTNEDVTSFSSSLNTNPNDSQNFEEFTTTPGIVDTTMAEVTVISSETQETEKNKTDYIPEYLSKTYLENPVVDSKERKNLDNPEGKTTPTKEEIVVKIEPDLNDSSLTFTEDPKTIYTETSYLTTIVSYETTTVLNQPLKNKPTESNIEADADLKKESMNLKNTEKTNESKIKKESDKLKKTEITSTALRSGNDDTSVEVRNSSRIDENGNKTDEKKPCNETSSKVGVTTDCDKEAQIIDNEPKVETTVDIPKPGPKESLRTGKSKPVYDSLIHFGDMQIKKEYEVYEVDSGKPAFVKQNERDNNMRTSIEQPQYAPVYNYDPENAYFNAFNRLGPNEDDRDDYNDRDDESESHELGNDKILRSKKKKYKLRMSKIDKHHKGKSYQKEDEFDSTTKPYFSKEANCEDEESEEKKDYEIIVIPESHETLMENVRLAAYSKNIFGYVPSNQERKDRVKEAKYLYNNVLGNSTEEILDISKGDIKQALRINDDGKYKDTDDAREDTRDDNEKVDKKFTKTDANDDKLEVVVIDMNKNPSLLLRQGGYFSSKYKWDEEGNSFRNDGKVYDLSHIVPYSTEKSLIVNQKGESNKIFDRIQNFIKQENDNNSAEIVEDIKKTIDSLKNMDISKTLFNQTHIDDMVEGVEKLVKTPSGPTRQFQYLKQKLAILRQQSNETKIDATNILRTKNCNRYSKCTLELMSHNPHNHKGSKAEKSKKFKAPNDALDTIKKITEITPEVDMYQNLERMLQINGLPIARSRDDDLGLHLKILQDMVKMDNKGLEEYDWLGTTVAVQSALAKLKEIIDQQKRGHDIHPADFNLLKYAEALYTKAREVTKEKEGETIDEYLEELKYADTDNNERTSLPKTHKKIRNPWKILLQISDMVNKKVLRNEVDDRTKNFELFLDCVQQCLDDFHTAIREISRVTKYKKQRWFKNIKELYLTGEKEHLEVLLHLYSMKLFGLIEDSAQKGAQSDYGLYMKENRFEVDRAQAEIMFIMRILKAIHDLKKN